jgi:hypothetical protein
MNRDRGTVSIVWSADIWVRAANWTEFVAFRLPKDLFVGFPCIADGFNVINAYYANYQVDYKQGMSF